MQRHRYDRREHLLLHPFPRAKVEQSAVDALPVDEQHAARVGVREEHGALLLLPPCSLAPAPTPTASVVRVTATTAAATAAAAACFRQRTCDATRCDAMRCDAMRCDAMRRDPIR